MKTESIEQIVARCDGSPKAIQEAVNTILMEETEIKVGDEVGVVDETVTVGGFVGKGKVKSFSSDKQYANIGLPDGTEVPVQTSLLYLVR